MTAPLLERCLQIYWDLGAYAIDDHRRMAAVLREVAKDVRSWAPAETRICFLQTHEIADQIEKCAAAQSAETPRLLSRKPDSAPTPKAESADGNAPPVTNDL